MDLKLFIIFCFNIASASQGKKNLTRVLTKPCEILNDPKTVTTEVCSTFQDLIQYSKIWVDKSLIIKEIWKENSTDVFIVTAPRGWGKTMTLSMIGYYHQLPINANGSAADRKTSANYLYFTEGEIIDNYLSSSAQQCDFSPLISGEQSLNNEHLANHPVIYVNGVDLVIGEHFVDCFRKMIWKTYQQHTSLYKLLIKKSLIANDDGENIEGSLNLVSFEKFVLYYNKFGSFPTTKSLILSIKEENIESSLNLDKFESYYVWSKIQNLDRERLKLGIKILSDLLEKTYKRKVVILFDEYDSFILNTYFGEYFLRVPSSKQILDVVDFLQEFVYETFKVNTHLVKGFITGVLPMLETTGLTGLNNVALQHVFGNDSFFPYYGIFDHEFRDLVSKRGMNQSSMEDAVAHYGGYHALGHLGDRIFSTFSAIEFVNTKVAKDYSTLTRRISQLFQQRNFSMDMAKVVKNWYKNKSVFKITHKQMTELTVLNLETIYNLARKKINYESDIHRNLVFSFLVSVGFLSVRPNQSNSNHEYQQYPIKTPKQVDITIPNMGIYLKIKRNIINYFKKYSGLFIESAELEFRWVDIILESK
ncbi:uncharacterized protein LOC135839865 [Planococcus citri]|uniref:uncharacterized protein LOC135839865 n=1 Tax=Planococcus citri TaxID=170843 RepID=UPI0031F7E471